MHTDRTYGASEPFLASNPSGIARSGKGRCNRSMSTKSREVIFGGQVRAAKLNAEQARQRAKEAAREADRGARLVAQDASVGQPNHHPQSDNASTVATLVGGPMPTLRD